MSDLALKCEDLLSAIHARQPRPSWDEAVAEVAVTPLEDGKGTISQG